MRTNLHLLLDPMRRSDDAVDFEDALKRQIVGQDTAIEKVSELYQIFMVGLNPPGRPIGNLLFLGPTGSGKTHLVEAMATTLLGDSRACIKIDCGEFQQSHDIAKLIGSPPGYLGHRETHPLLTQEALNQWHTGTKQISLLLFDEIEKASDSLWNLLLGILDKATLTLGDNRRVDFSQTLIVMTSNLGSNEMERLMNGGKMGFRKPSAPMDTGFHNKMERAAIDAARRKFSPEFMNRIDKTVVFKPLKPEHLEQILEIELGMVQERILEKEGNNQFVFQCTQPVKDFLLREGTDMKYGARPLKRAIERHIMFPLANLKSTEQLKLGDLVLVRQDEKGNLIFVKIAEDALSYVFHQRYPTQLAAAARVGQSLSERPRQNLRDLLDNSPFAP